MYTGSPEIYSPRATQVAEIFRNLCSFIYICCIFQNLVEVLSLLKCWFGYRHFQEFDLKLFLNIIAQFRPNLIEGLVEVVDKRLIVGQFESFDCTREQKFEKDWLHVSDYFKLAVLVEIVFTNLCLHYDMSQER